MSRSGSPYVELHCHSAYSFLDGASLPEELAERAGELGHVALALTDHNSVSGSMELAQIASSCGIRAIHGAEIDVALPRRGRSEDRPDTRHLTLLVRDERGWSNLCRIITLAHAHTRDGTARRRRAEPWLELQGVLDHAEGLVCLTGCAARSVLGDPARAEEREQGQRTARLLLEAFGAENLYVELQRPYARHDRARNRAFAQAAGRLGVRCVATGDVHAHAPARAELQDAFVALRHHLTLDASEPLRRGNHSHVLSTPQAMASRFADHPQAVRETLALAERLTFDLLKDLGYRYPGAEERDATARLAQLCHTRLDERYGSGPTHAHGSALAARGRDDRSAAAARAEAQARLERELRVIDHLGLAGFFLLHHDMLELAREVAMEVRGPDSVRALLAPGRGRGSSVSSLVCYLTGLSHIDPIANGLALGRFLHEDLRGLPDIDLDFPRDIRERLIPRVHERYGAERAALVAAFPTYRVRGAVRELGKVLGLPAGEIERAARSADAWGRDPSDIPEQAADSSRWRWLSHLVEQAHGLPRHLSQHPGGMVIATRPLIDCCPVVPAAMEGRQMVQWDKDSCADAGFLKIDLLGLGMLSAVERCVEEIARVRGERIDLSRIPFDDQETFRAISVADTVGVFQIESRAQMQSLLRTRPRNLQDLTIQVAIVRPGPIQGGAINPYIERRQRLREEGGRGEGGRGSKYEIPYEHPALEPVLAETLGTVIFQDQVMEVAEAFAGFSPGEAAALRRAMSRKRSHASVQSHRQRFLEGAARHVGADPQTAERVWAMVEGFAGFGFPKAHGAAFGLLAYQSTWLRVHYGAEFLCALLNEQPMGFYAPDSLVHEAENRKVPIAVLGVDVNASHVQCTVQDGAVRLGLSYIKGAANAEMQALVQERERGGPFASLGELAGRVACSRATLEQLAWSGACDSLTDVPDARAPAGADEAPAGPWQASRRTALWQLGMAPAAESAGDGRDGQATQLALPLELPAAPRLRKLGRWQRLIADYSTSGVTIGEHPMKVLRERLTIPSGADPVVLATSAQLARLPTRSRVAVAGLVIARQKPGTAKGTMFLLFEDELGTINLIVPKDVYERHRPLARAEPLLLAFGRLERSLQPAGPDESAADIRPVINVIVRELQPLERHLLAERGDEPAAEGGRVHRLPDSEQATGEDQRQAERAPGADVASSMRAVAPPVQSFAMGRRR
ncbi:MAG TPA: DNA polymerase III subunit alpha [Solirubrobacteraceae bacterium]|nr:DNA polymerase III subunit alpha [Solirubrobacteraceae bacterium]